VRPESRQANTWQKIALGAGLILLPGIISFALVWWWSERVEPIGFHPRRTANVGGPHNNDLGNASPSRADERLGTRAPTGVAPNEPLPDPVYHRRDKDEWQGMLVNLSMQALCDGTKSCGLAAACVSGRCGPCSHDRECGSDELCALDHCVLRQNATCRSRRDCRTPDSRCILTGYSSDPRGNLEMRSQCLEPSGGEARAESLPSDEGIPPSTMPVAIGDVLLKSVRQHVRHDE
jgi:hypothetical protein